MRRFTAAPPVHPPGQSSRRASLLALGALLTTLVIMASSAVSAGAASAAPRAATQGSATTQATFNHTIHVPADFPTIQAAVNAATAGDLVLIAKGVYHEAVDVKTPGITIRGEDRMGVELDGRDASGKPVLPNGIYVEANDVIIENMTAHHYVGNGFFWKGVTGYRGSYLTAYDLGDYGIYARTSSKGEFDHSLASGSPDSGFYIGECFPCDALITDVHSEWNGLGYSGTNAGGNLVIKNSVWTKNAAGIVPNTLLSEGLAPQRGATIIDNQVYDNNNEDAPAFESERTVLGVGIGLMAGNQNYVARNNVHDQGLYGILVGGIITKGQFFVASNNVVEQNTIKNSGVADMALSAPTGPGNCFSDNKAKTTLPPLLEVTHACGTPLPNVGGGDMAPTLLLYARDSYNSSPNYHTRDWSTVPAPPAALQPNMPDINAPRGDIFTEPFPLAASLPRNGIPPQVPSGGPSMLQPLGFTAYTIFQILLAFFGNFLFFTLYAAWVAIALWEIAHRKELSTRAQFGWGALVIAVPIIGPIVYYFAGKSQLSRNVRLGLVVGAPLLLIAITVVMVVLAGMIQ
jgi:Right handed beta helix region/Phospholipase_D-nuclease N-terminal